MERNQKKPMNKSNLIYIKSKINKIPYRNKICSTSRASLSEKINLIILLLMKVTLMNIDYFNKI